MTLWERVASVLRHLADRLAPVAADIDLDLAKRESLRELILSLLDAARPVDLDEQFILTSLGDVPLEVTQAELRRELNHLEEHGLVELMRRESAWLARRGRDANVPPEDIKTFEPGPDLVKAVRIGFIRQGTTMNAWCEARRINRGNATIALLGGWRGPKGRAVARRVAKAAGVGEIKWNQ